MKELITKRWNIIFRKLLNYNEFYFIIKSLEQDYYHYEYQTHPPHVFLTFMGILYYQFVGRN